ncbi:endonuclease/exonuclease/phosphatase family protein [Clostridium tepidiprofundi DSM 19306]|uniref:Endonuclease/exonuclease/phosphatase family protein n=1 Tax=Clostridium tepidiprofundi DSM 19306 TaxID=1121338 RepID=A0A151B3B9_9CLOT|nr:chitobiase/beta-hexosaminidase C-terminal domain-containing protein [Clostridium tepidiprofundi]KYH34290.1 endonuclease/exonuclease/phosphatase family protein [Clostridium tepidiprofundi DSM 19306]
MYLSNTTRKNSFIKKTFKNLSIILCFSIIFNYFIGLTSIQATETVSKDLIISEYVEGSGNDYKAIELYNNSGHDVDLSNYSLINCFNGNQLNEGSVLKLNGNLKYKDTLVIVVNKNLKSKLENLGVNNVIIGYNAINFNGDDALVLKKGNTIIDSIGKVGERKVWSSGSISTKDHTLIRKSSVLYGDTIINDNFDPSIEWISFPKNDITHLGYHEIDSSSENIQNSAIVNATPAPGEVEKGTKITLSTSTTGSSIYFTLNGEDPISNGLLYTNPIEINEDKTITAVAKKDEKYGKKSSFKYTIKKPLKLISIKSARQKNKGEKVLIEGVITGKIGNNAYIQDNTAGIYLYAGSNIQKDFVVGNKVSIVGEIDDWNNLKQLKNIECIKLISTGNTLIPKKINASDIGEDLESQLVKISNIELTEVPADSYKGYTIKAKQGETQLQLRVDSHIAEDIDSNNYKNGFIVDIIGIIGQYKSNYQIMLRNKHDIITNSSRVKPVESSVRPGIIKKGTKITLYTETIGAKIYYTLDGSKPTCKSILYNGQAIILNKNSTIKAIAIKENMLDSLVKTFNFIVREPGEATRIRYIQGQSHISPLINTTVDEVMGIVTAVEGTKAFYMQDPNPDNDIKTSEGIYVYKYKSGVKVGDLVKVTGTVKEIVNGFEGGLTTTEIAATNVSIESHNNPLPKPVIVGIGGRIPPTQIIDNDSFNKFDPDEDAIDFYESLEGMLVEINNPLIVGISEKYGEITVVGDDGQNSVNKKSIHNGLVISKDNFNPERITIDDVLVPLSNRSKKFINPNFKVKVGDKFANSVIGVMSYGYGKYTLLNTEALPKIIDGGAKREITKIVPNEDKLTIASYNIENFSSKTDPKRITGIAKSIINNLKAPDIVSLIEIQDNDGSKNTSIVDASQTYKKLIDTIIDNGGPKYKFTDINPVDDKDGGIPGGNIRVGFIYRSDRVSLVNDGKKGDPTESVKIVGKNATAHLSVNPGRIAPTNEAFEHSRKSLVAEFNFKGQKVFIIGNHLCSKRGDDGLFGSHQPPKRNSEIQRHKQATVINNFVDQIFKANPNANVVVLGDLNDFNFSETVSILKGKGNNNVLTNMIDKLPKNERFSYVHEGNSQVLDNILVSNHLVDSTTIDIVNINSEFIDACGRVSDHDPVLIQMKLQNQNSDTNVNNDIILDILTPQENLDNIKVGGDAKITIRAKNISQSTKDITLIIALYDKNNSMLNYSATKISLKAGESSDMTSSMKVIAGGSKIKCMIWDSLEKMSPLRHNKILYIAP